MKLLKITTQGLIDITNTEVMSYNRAAILKEGWRLKRAGIKDGLAQAWKAARTQMNNLKELIAETEQERADYIEDYSMAYEVAGDLISDGIEPEEGPMADALHDYKEMVAKELCRDTKGKIKKITWRGGIGYGSKKRLN